MNPEIPSQAIDSTEALEVSQEDEITILHVGRQSTHCWTVEAIETIKKIKVKVKGVNNLRRELRIVVDFDDQGQAIGEAQALLARFLGTLVADCKLFPMDYDRWFGPLGVPKAYFDDCFKTILKDLCKRNNKIRSKQVIPHNGGSKANPRRRNELEQIQVGLTESTIDEYEVSPLDVVGRVLGLEHSGRVRCMGLGVVPSNTFRNMRLRVSNLSSSSSGMAFPSSSSYEWKERHNNLESAFKAYIIMKEGRIPEELATYFTLDAHGLSPNPIGSVGEEVLNPIGLNWGFNERLSVGMGDLLGSFPESVRVKTKHAEKSCGGMGELLGSFPDSVRVRTKQAEKSYVRGATNGIRTGPLTQYSVVRGPTKQKLGSVGTASVPTSGWTSQKGLPMEGSDRCFLLGKILEFVLHTFFSVLYPERVLGVVTLGVPYVPPGPSMFHKLFPEGFYILRWKEPGRAKADFGRFDVNTVVRNIYILFSRSEIPIANENQETMDLVEPDTPIPSWFTEEDLATYGALYKKSGFQPALQIPYRSFDEVFNLPREVSEVIAKRGTVCDFWQHFKALISYKARVISCAPCSQCLIHVIQVLRALNKFTFGNMSGLELKFTPDFHFDCVAMMFEIRIFAI
ncbi:hypothetical protein Fmac_011015 [Flemingia macrophylla]|uniref:Uncharacterized protein n=1 Tax=Flemingia macrophylla TaxID=520843 RepID=A0ABD1ML86_9FABA